MRTEEEIRLKAKEIAEHQSVLYEKFCTAFDEKDHLGVIDAISNEVRSCGDKLNILSWVMGYLEQ